MSHSSLFRPGSWPQLVAAAAGAQQRAHDGAGGGADDHVGRVGSTPVPAGAATPALYDIPTVPPARATKANMERTRPERVAPRGHMTRPCPEAAQIRLLRVNSRTFDFAAPTSEARVEPGQLRRQWRRSGCRPAPRPRGHSSRIAVGVGEVPAPAASRARPPGRRSARRCRWPRRSSRSTASADRSRARGRSREQSHRSAADSSVGPRPPATPPRGPSAR